MSFLQKAASHTTDWLVQGGSISEDEREVYEYGLDKLFSSLTHFLFTVCLGFLFGIPGLTMLFFVSYYIIRIYAGGYHAETPQRCFLTSVGIMIPTLTVMKFWQVWFVAWVFYALLALGSIVLVLIAPVAHKNKMLDEREKVVYRRRMLRNLSVAVITALILFQLSYHGLAVSVLCGVLLAMLMALTGKIKLLVESEHVR